MANRERWGDLSEFLLLVGERVADAAYRARVQVVKATRIGRIRMEMVMLRRERRAAIFRLGEAALGAIQENRVLDPVLTARAREVDDVNATLAARAEEASRIADLPDEDVLRRRREAAEGAAGPTAGPTAAPVGPAPDGAAGRTLDAIPVARRDPVDLAGEQ
jgi:hypothetical protein